jgi:CYTH domain-containing protein
MEIERKFLVKHKPKNWFAYPSDKIVQHYLSLEPELRIRKINYHEHILTIKSSGDMVRKEVEFKISEDKFNELATMSIGHIKKIRYYIDKFEFDIYCNIEGLMTVEIEFDSEEDANRFVKPNWFGEEVTSDESYKNKNLAMNLLL